MGQVLQTNSTYKIKTYDGSTPANSITFDTAEVHIVGNLVVDGTQTTVNVDDLAIKDNIIKLNQGETGDGVTLQYSGIAVDRGFSDSPTNANPNLFSTLWFNENNHAWEILDQDGGIIQRFDNSNLKLRTILTDSATDSGDLTLIGSGTGVVKVLGTTNYEQQVRDDDDLTNKRYVDLAIKNKEPDNRIQRDDTLVIVKDLEGGASAVALLKVLNISIGSGGGGTDYAVGDIVTLSGGTPLRPAVVQVTALGPLNSIDTFTVLDTGEYSSLPPSNTNVQSTVAYGTGVDATFGVDWEVSRVEITNGGNDYDTADVTFMATTPVGDQVATGTTTVDSDTFSATYRQILSVTLVDNGVYSTEVPDVRFSATGTPALTESQVEIKVDGITSATFYEDRVDIGNLEISQNTISTNIASAGTNIILETQSNGKVEINFALQLSETGGVVDYVTNSAVLYGDVPSVGQTGLYYNSEKQSLSWDQWVTNNNTYSSVDLALNPVKNELISKNKALVMSMLF